MKFKFKALKQGGEKYEGEREAENKFALYEVIRKEGGTVVHVEVARSHGPRSFKMPSFFNKVKTTDKIQFAKNLGVMIEAGLPITRAIAVMERQSGSKIFKSRLADLNAAIGRGETLSSAMEKFPDTFSKLFQSMVKAGEESGSLTSSLKAVGSQLEKANMLAKKIRGAMIYPAIIVLIMIVLDF